MTSFKAYKKELSINSSIDLQTIYEGDANGSDATITTNGTDGSVVIAGTESLSVTATNGVSITNALTLINKTSGSVLFASTAGLVQQDNANLFWDDTNNRLGIGSAVPGTSLHVVETSIATARGLTLDQVTPNGSASQINIRKARNTPSSPTAVLLNDNLGSIQFQGHDGTAYTSGASGASGAGASIQVTASENWGAGGHGTQIAFVTIANTTTIPVTRLQLLNDGRINHNIDTLVPRTVSLTSANFNSLATSTSASLTKTGIKSTVGGDWGVGVGGASIAFSSDASGADTNTGATCVANGTAASSNTGGIFTASGAVPLAKGVLATATGSGALNIGLEAFASGSATQNQGLVVAANGVATLNMGILATATTVGATTNIGLEAQAGGATDNYAAIFTSGYVGVGTSTPTALFSVGAGSPFQVDVSGNLTTSGAILATSAPVGIGTSLPTSLFSVGAGLISQFQIDINGNILRINDVPTSFPSGQGAASSYLVNDGAGNLTWESPRASQLELDTTQGSLGAAIDGSGAWLGFSGTNYLDAELTITSSLIKLDTQLASTTAWLVKDANYTASSGDKILADTNNIGAFTITLPSSPTPGMEVSVVDAANTWGTNNLTISSGAENIAGLASPFIFNVTAEVWGRFVYFNPARGWVLST